MYEREPHTGRIALRKRNIVRFCFANTLMKVLRLALEHDSHAQVIVEDGDLIVLYKTESNKELELSFIQVLLEGSSPHFTHTKKKP